MTETYLRNELSAFEKRIAYRFGDMELLEQALTHSSLRDTQIPTNERLEFLGDAILGQVISEHLFERFLDFDEGDLTRIKSVVVSTRNLAQTAREMGFGDAVRVGKGLRKNPLPDSLLADALEAVIAAIYIDGGMDETRRFILQNLKESVSAVLEENYERNFKSLLQALAQRHHHATPRYTVIREEGPDHVKTFEVAALVGRRRFAPGKGRSKKEAEQRAAEKAYAILLAEMAPASDSDEHPPPENHQE